MDGVIRGVKFDDTNFNGAIDASDPPVPGVRIYADLNNNGVRDFTDPSAITDASGAYSLYVPGSVVTLREELPDGYDVVLPAGGSVVVQPTPADPRTVNWLNRRRLDWGDAPDPAAAALYPTLSAHNGARHVVLKGYSLGPKIDPEPDGQPNATATGDDIAGAIPDDEDGVTFLTPLVSGSPATVQVDFTSTGGLTGVLDAWIDFNGNGSWADPGERIATTFVLAPGPNLLSFAVPATAVAGQTFARFRLSPNGVTTFTGTGFLTAGPPIPVAGEVEDYQVRVEGGQQLDWGDAPDTSSAPGYPTLAVHNGARHEILQGLQLGGKIDAEPDGQPNATATGDDLSGSADEDGVSIGTLTVGAAASANVTLTSAAGSNGFLDAWIDFNRDGDWADVGEQIATNVVLTPGVNVVNFAVPASANPGPTYARFRLAQTAADVTSFDGFGGKGEVEDYNPRIVGNTTGELDWGDAPNIPGTILQYPTTAAQNGARHTINTNFRLGNLIDPEADGQPNINSDGDDTNATDDEDGVTFLDPLIPGTNARIQIVLNSSTGSGRLDAWIDWNADGNWPQPIDRIANAFPLVNGPNILVVAVPATAATTKTYSRFRLSQQGGLPFSGFGGNGEVEDYPVAIRPPQNRKLDWGDAPNGGPLAPGYPTLAANNGARHLIKPGFWLGFGVDAEADGQPTASADGDDTNGVPDDEDGVTFATPLTPGSIATINVLAPAGGVLDAWIDWNANFSWADPGDRIATTLVLAPGLNVLNVPVPAGAKIGSTYARFRLSPNGVPSYDGYGFEGEVEDYKVQVIQHGEFDFGDAPRSYHTLLVDNGARNTVRPGFTLGNFVDAELDGQPSANADRDDLTAIDDEDGVTLVGGSLTSGANAQFNVVASANGILDAWLDLNMNGSFADPGEHIFAGVALIPGNNALNFVVPATTPSGDTYARFRLGHTATPSFDGFGGEGETEDYKYSVKKPTGSQDLDFGDAPDQPFPTTLASNGARHSFLPGFTLGYRWDAEPNGQPNITASGDDAVGIDDEDGVFFPTPFIRGTNAQIQVLAPAGGRLDAWMDFNGNGLWTDAGEQIATSFPLVPGMNVLTVPVPAGPTAISRAYSRFRLSTNGGLSFTGAGGDGEVEDYQTFINAPAVTHTDDGFLHITGTPGADHVALQFLSTPAGGEVIGVDLLDIDSGGPEYQFPALDTCWIENNLGGGDDALQVRGMPGPEALATLQEVKFDGGAGKDQLMFDESALNGGIHADVGAQAILIGMLLPAVYMHQGFEDIALNGTGFNDVFMCDGSAMPAGSVGPSVELMGAGGDDNFIIAVLGSGLFSTAIGVDGGSQNAGGPGDTLTLLGDGSVRAAYTPMGGVFGAGDVSLNPQPFPPGMVSFSGLEPVNVASFASFDLNMPAGASGNDTINVDPVSLDIGDSSTISGTSSGTGFEQATITDIGTFTLNTAANDAAAIGGSTDVVNFNGSILSADSFTMPAGRADLTLHVNAGSIPIGWDPGSLTAPVHVTVFNGATVHFGVTQHLNSLDVNAGGTAVVDPGGDKVLVTKTLTLGVGGVIVSHLDLTNNGMIVDYTGASPASQIRANLVSGRNGGAWNGGGIMTSSAAALPGTGIGYFDNTAPSVATFLGQAVDNTSVLVRYTYEGDSNLDGKVDVTDLGNLATNWQKSGVWRQGDFDYSNFVDVTDLGILATNWQKALPGASAPVGSKKLVLPPILQAALNGATVELSPETVVGTGKKLVDDVPALTTEATVD